MSRLSPMRPFFILAPLGMLYLAILGRVVQLHAAPDEVVNGVSEYLHNKVELPAMRGSIVDRNGKSLAHDRPAFWLMMTSVWEDRRYHPNNRPKGLTDDDIAAEIAEIAERCQVPVQKMAETLLSKEVGYTLLRRGLTPFEGQELRAFLRKYRSTGLQLVPMVEREYPLGRTFGSLLGIVTAQDEKRSGASGLEVKFDEHLTGTEGSKGSQMVTGAFGVNPAKGLEKPEQGGDLRLTLDADLGTATREILDEAMVELKAEWCGAVVLDANTGELLTLIGLPDYDPRDPIINDDLLDNSGIRSTFALTIDNPVVPGSTFKPFLIAYAIEQGIVSRSEVFEDRNTLKVKGRREIIENADGVKYGPKTAAECLIHSSNVVSVLIGLRTGIERFRDMQAKFGLWDPLYLGQRPMNTYHGPPEKNWTNRQAIPYTLASSSFGHEFMVNPIRYAACFASLINGGHRIEPYLLMDQQDATTEQAAERDAKRVGVERPISEETSDFIVDALEKMVERRIGSPLPEIEGVRWGGKSGTARHETKPHLNTCAFAAFGPIPDPEIVVLVIVQWPDVKGRISGTRLSGPLAGKILEHALRTRGLLPKAEASRLDSASSNANLNPRLKEVR